jgi:5-methyltetrahydrofolate--homocysteine methyltransferase
MVDFQKIGQSVIEGNRAKAQELTKAALEGGVAPESILSDGLIPGIRKVGELFGKGEYYLPELLVSAKAMSAATDILKPELSKANVPPVGKYAIGTVRGDLHDIGKKIVIMMLRGNGWQVTDLGVDVPPEDFCDAVAKGEFDILGMSALLTTTMPAVIETLDSLKSAGLRDKVKIMVGGAPIKTDWVEEIGADGYASDAAEAITVAEALLQR